MNKRDEMKINTRKKILRKTQKLLERDGLLRLSSKTISNECGVSQGTIFLHFKTKETLFNQILHSNIDLLQSTLEKDTDPSMKPEVFIKTMLDTLVLYEDLLSRVYKDYAYLDDALRKQIDGFENVIKNLILSNFRNHSKKKVSIVDSFILIDAFLSQFKNYLITKEYSSVGTKVIKQRKGRITKLYSILFVR